MRQLCLLMQRLLFNAFGPTRRLEMDRASFTAWRLYLGLDPVPQGLSLVDRCERLENSAIV
jgi:hypothetical protein